MPTQDWLRKEFRYGYDSGDVLAEVPNPARAREETLIGGSYRHVFLKAAVPYLRPDARVLELGPGRGSWTRAFLEYVPNGEVQTLDYQDVGPWLNPAEYGGRLVCHRANDNFFREFSSDYFDLFWSFGVLCHCNIDHIREILNNALSKVRRGGYAIHQYADWDKLDRWGWARGGVPEAFKDQPDDAIWWPRNNRPTMCGAAEEAGWDVVAPDLALVARDGIIVLRRPT